MSVPSLQGELSKSEEDGQSSFTAELDALSNEIKKDPDSPLPYVYRARLLLKHEKFKEAASEARRAEQLGADWEAYLVHGKALFNLGQYMDSLDTFTKGKAKGGSKTVGLDPFEQWIIWCEERIKKLGLSKDSKISEEESKMESDKKDAGNVMPVPKIKHDWYQTETHVILTVLIKNQKKDEVKVEFTDTTVSVSAPLESGSEYSLELDLCHPIKPDECSFKVLSSKIEVKMKKVDGLRWPTLEGDGSTPTVKSSSLGTSGAEKVPSYPTSSSKKHDWNKLEAEVKKEEEEEKLEGDAALNQLFQKIYGEGSEETRRAMNKSFMESGGTVLSTNWKEVAGKKVDVKPPDGMEFKKWEQ